MSNDLGIQVEAESTWLNPATDSKEKLIDWILTMLGAPLVTVELDETQLNTVIQNALEKYTKYAWFPDQYLVVNLKDYIPGKGLDLKKYNILGINDIAFGRDRILGLTNTDVFFGPQAWFLGNGGGSGGGYPFFGSRGNFSGSFITYHNLHEFFDLTNRVTGSNPQFQYYKTTKILKLMPEPQSANSNKDSYALLTCQVCPPLEELYSNEYVKRLALAYAKIILGTVRKKFQNVSLVGGGQIDTSIFDEGKEELNQIMENIQKEEACGQFFCIC